MLTDEGELTTNGSLAILKQWPAMLRGIYGNDEREKNPALVCGGGKYYYSSDAVIKDEDGYYWIVGRLDDIVNVAGHNISTADLEGVTCEHTSIAESAYI